MQPGLSAVLQTLKQRVRVEALPDGSFVVAWHSAGADPDRDSIYAQRFDAAGLAVGGEFLVNTRVPGDQRWAAIDGDAQGNFVIAWSSLSQDGSSWGVYFQKYDAAGEPLGLETRATVHTEDSQLYPALAVAGSGEFIVSSQGQRTGGAYDIFARRIDASGTPVGGDLAVNTIAGGGNVAPAVAVAPSGSAMLVWQGGQDGQGTGIAGRLYAPVPDAASAGGCGDG